MASSLDLSYNLLIFGHCGQYIIPIPIKTVSFISFEMFNIWSVKYDHFHWGFMDRRYQLTYIDTPILYQISYLDLVVVSRIVKSVYSLLSPSNSVLPRTMSQWLDACAEFGVICLCNISSNRLLSVCKSTIILLRSCNCSSIFKAIAFLYPLYTLFLGTCRSNDLRFRSFDCTWPMFEFYIVVTQLITMPISYVTCSTISLFSENINA